MLALALVPVLGCGDTSTAGEVGPVEHRVQRGDFTQRTLLTGEMMAEESVPLVAPNANIWPIQIRWLANEGSPVGEGEAVMEFDNSQLTSNLEQMRAEVVEKSNNLVSVRSRVAGDLSKALYDFEQKKALHEKALLEAKIPADIQPRLEYERKQLEARRAGLEFNEAKLELETVRQAGQAEIRIKELEVEGAQRKLQTAEEGIQVLTVTAPRDGIFLISNNPWEDRPFQNGDTTWPGNVVARLPDLSTMLVEARLFDVDDGQVVPGQNVEVTLDAFPGETYRGQVREVDGVAQGLRSSQRRFFRVLVDLERTDAERMRPGMSVKLVMEGETAQNVLLVPRHAVHWADGKTWLDTREGRAPVEVGACNPSQCYLLSGAEEGTRIASSREGTPDGA